MPPPRPPPPRSSSPANPPGPPPQEHGSRPPHPARERTLDRFVDRPRIDRLLAPLVPDDDDRAFVLRCLLEEGPAHHRGANWVLLALLGEALGPDAVPHDEGEQVAIRLRLPPHLRDERDDDDGVYPLRLPLAPLRRLVGGDERAVEAMVACLTDGPPQHALANAAMVHLLAAVLRR
jgi:hypothetical protein